MQSRRKEGRAVCDKRGTTAKKRERKGERDVKNEEDREIVGGKGESEQNS